VPQLLATDRYRLWGSPDDLPVPADLGGFEVRITPPPAEQVLRAAIAVWDHVAAATSTPPASRPADLDGLVADGTRLLRRANGWDR
jgi:hypothetical protein